MPAVGFLVALVITALAPDRRFWAISASLGVLMSTVVFVWAYARRGRKIFGLEDWLRPRRSSLGRIDDQARRQ